MEITMSGYEKHLGKQLGTEIKGIFTDEPQIASPGGIRWTPDLFEVFRKQWGYDLKSVLPLLAEETGNWKQVRHNYTETLTQMFIDRWAKPWFDYCEKKNLLWTGHYWEHGWPDMSHGGDNMAMYAWHQMPAIDMLFNQFNDIHPQAQFGNVRAVKELRSAANQLGYVRTLSETYGGGGWDVTFEDLKRLGDWEYVLGVNFMNQHLSHMTIVGARKYDYPPVFTSLSPWWPEYKTQNDYFARLSMLLSQGEQENEILVLEPTTTAWLYYSYVKSHPTTMEIGMNFQQFVTKLEKSQVEHDLGSENIIKDQGRVKNNLFVVGKRGYKKVVIPPMTENLNRTTFNLLQKFVASGGELIVFSQPSYIDGKESTELKTFFDAHSSRIRFYREEAIEEAIAQSFQNDKIKFQDISGNDLYHHRRTYTDGELVFLVNSSLTETAKGQLSLGVNSMIEIDGMSGEMFAYPCEQQGKHAMTTFELPPAGSLLLFSPLSDTEKYKPRSTPATGKRLSADTPVQVKRMKDNVLLMDFCDLTIDGTTERNLYNVEACSKLYKYFGMNNPWNSSIQYRQTNVEKDTFRTGDIQVQYKFIIAENIDKGNLKLVIEQPGLWQVKMNGKTVNAIPGAFWLDNRNGVYNVGEYIKSGVNVVELSRSPMSIYAEIAPAYLLGDFSLESAPNGWVIKKPVEQLTTGSWKSQGHPHYSWDVSYRKEYTIENTSSQYTLQLNKWQGTVAEVYVNGSKAGVVAYKPYNFDLSPFLKQGTNTIEVRVIGSLKNLLGPHFNWDKGIAGPWHWNNVQKQLPGDDYNLIEYGLFEDFSVYQAR
ncbi:MAG: hypothetical protein LUD74_00020 [Tannerellaceae bacterium]|nr:hypothetical protein [Tannerellaceae bacterium]